MLQFGCCPACGNEIPQDRMINNGTIVCECGWTRSVSARQSDRLNVDRTCASILLIGASFILLFIHAINWDSYFFSIIPLKLKEYTGMAQPADFQQIAEICEARKKHECVESALASLATQQPQRLDVLARLGKLQVQQQKMINATQTYAVYFLRQGQDPEAAYNYAKALGFLNRFDEAQKYYEFILKAKPNVLQVTIARSYINMLMQANRLNEARIMIQTYRRKGTSTGLFMEKELKEIESRITQARI